MELPSEVIDLIMAEPLMIAKARLVSKKYICETDFWKKIDEVRQIMIKHGYEREILLISKFVFVPDWLKNWLNGVRYLTFSFKFPEKLSDYRSLATACVALNVLAREKIALSDKGCALLDSFIPSRPFGDCMHMINNIMRVSHHTDNKFVCYCWNKYSRPVLLPRKLYECAMNV